MDGRERQPPTRPPRLASNSPPIGSVWNGEAAGARITRTVPATAAR